MRNRLIGWTAGLALVLGIVALASVAPLAVGAVGALTLVYLISVSVRDAYNAVRKERKP